jgi:predicted DNA-binding protein
MALDRMTSFKINPEDEKRLELVAKASNKSVSAVIREAIKDSIYGPAWALEILEQVKKQVEAEYASRFAILETAKLQVEEKIKALTEDAANLTVRVAELLQKESAIEDPKEALEFRKQYAEIRDLLDITNERLKTAREKHAEIIRGIAQLEKEKAQALNEALRQAFPHVCEPLLENAANRLADIANALQPYLQAFTSEATSERTLARFLWTRLAEMAAARSSLARDLLGRPNPLYRANYQNWPAFWQFWAWQTSYKVPVEDKTGVEQRAEDSHEAPSAEVEEIKSIKIEI